MSRFPSYVFKEQVGDELVMIGQLGRERRVGFKIIRISGPDEVQDRFAAWFRSGAWVIRRADGSLGPLFVYTASSDLEALTLFLAELRAQVELFDQFDQQWWIDEHYGRKTE